MKTKHIVIQMIKEEKTTVTKEECNKEVVIDSKYSYLVRLDKYVTKNIVVTKGSYRDVREDEDYKPGGEYRGEEEFQMLVNFFKKEGYEVI